MKINTEIWKLEEETDWKEECMMAYSLLNLQLSRVTLKKLYEIFYSAQGIYLATKSELLEILPEQTVENIIRLRSDKERKKVEKMFQDLREDNITFLPINHPEFPEKLKNIPDSPRGIFFRGQLPNPRRPSVAVIGARMCSNYGEKMATHFAQTLAMEGVQIISGLARGIDGIGQAAAIRAGGRTFGILGCGVDICYPSENELLYQNVIKNGGIISEYLPGTKPLSYNFPPRNRIISGLSDVILVVEAKVKSGTLITVDMALEQGREVFVIPGRASDALSEGCNRLIKQGAALAINPEDILTVIQKKVGAKEQNKDLYDRKKKTYISIEEIESMTLEEKQMLCVEHLLDSYPKPYGEIEAEWIKFLNTNPDMKIQDNSLPSVLMKLCLKRKAVRTESGHYYHG